VENECIVITWLARDQPGFLDFAYRIQSLAKVYRTTLVSPYALTQPELAIPAVEHCVLEHNDGRSGWLRYMLDCARLIRARRPACAVLLHSMVAPLTLLVRKTPIALYWNEHPSRFTASPPGHPWIKRIARKLALTLFFMNAAKKATVVMPISEAHYDDMICIGCDPRRVKLLYMGVDRSFLQSGEPQPRTADAPLELIYNGTVNHQRGRDVMLEGLALANSEGQLARLTIVGASADQIAYCTDYAKQLGIDNTVDIRGRVPGHEIPALLFEADFGLCFMEDLPWWRFNPPTKLFEYLVSGVPVLASDIRTHTHYVSDWHNGLICKYDSQSLANGILRIWQRRTELVQLKQRARRSGEAYLWDRIEPEFLQTVQSIVQLKNAGSAAQAAQDHLLLKRAPSTDHRAGES
jgi:glycosyltransferase involved in cell wall biosynthesis